MNKLIDQVFNSRSWYKKKLTKKAEVYIKKRIKTWILYEFYKNEPEEVILAYYTKKSISNNIHFKDATNRVIEVVKKERFPYQSLKNETYDFLLNKEGELL